MSLVIEFKSTDESSNRHYRINTFSNPFKKWEDISQFEFNGVIILKSLKKVLKLSNKIRDLISSTWYGFDELETGVENIIFNIHLVENFKKK